MKTYVKISGQKFDATIYRCHRDIDWSGRESRTITAKMSYAQAKDLFVDDAPWSIIQEHDPVQQPDGGTAAPDPEVYDNSEYCIAGPILDHRDGTVSIKMGKPTADELLAVILEGRQ